MNAEISFDPRVGNERPPNECVPKTRDYILGEIGSWARDFEQPSVYWLNGLAGTGKSTIALTLAKKIEGDDGGWVCKFFCSRKSEGSGKPLNIFSVLARLLAHKYTAFGLMYILAIDSNPGILDSPPRDQMNELLIEPLKKSGISAVIMIDGLDLCDKETVSAILGSLAESAPKIPQVKFLITSRPTPHIREGFGPLVKSGHVTIFDLHKVDPVKVNYDILLLFENIFSEIRDRDQLDNDWPAKEFPYVFCKRADGLLAYAAAEARYMNPGGMVFAEDQPGELVNQTEGEFLEENAHWEKEKSICALYMSVLQDAFGDWKPGDDQKVRSVLGVIALAERFLSPSAIATLLGFDREHVLLCLKSAEPLLFLHEDSPVKPLHKSFAVFLTDQNLCKDEKFYVSPPIHHEELLIGCLKLMNNGLKENMCEFSCAFEYAWASWDTHLAGTTETQNVSNIIEHLHPFLEQNILNCQKAPRGVTGDAMNALEKWSLQVSSVFLVPTPSLFSQ